jgi:uroporphyrinogen-III decarboxylase
MSKDLFTSGERLVRCLAGEDVDRVPFGVGIGWGLWGETMERWRRESGQPDLNVAEALGYEPGFANPAIESGPFPHFEPVVLEKTEDMVVSRDWRGITMRNRLDGGSMPEFLGYPVKTPNDWERLKAERYKLDADTIDKRIDEDWELFRARLRTTGEAVQVGAFPWGVFGTARDLLGAEELLVAFYTEPDMIKDIMSHLTSLWLLLWERVADQVQIDHIHIWEDMSGKQGSLISPDMVETFMMPCYDRIADFAKARGVRLISVDTDGDCQELVPVMMRHGVNTFFPFEVQAGNDIREYRRQYPNLGILGGLDKNALARDKAAIDIEIEKARWMLENGGRYIPGFDHLIPPDASWENFRYAAENLREFCFTMEPV